MRLAGVVGIVIAPLLVTAATVWGAGAKSDFDHPGLAREALDRHIRPGYARLTEVGSVLRQRLDEGCDAPTPAWRKAADAAFAEMVRAWSRIEHIRFGPIAGAHRHARMAYWPDPKGVGGHQVKRALRRQDPAVTRQADLAKKSVALQGLTALEIVLFKAGGGAHQADQHVGFRCAYAQAIAANLVTISRQVSKSWGDDTRGYARTWLNPGPENAVYRAPEEVSHALVLAFTTSLESVRDIQLMKPLGLGKSGVNRRRFLRRTRPAYVASGLSIAALRANLEGLHHLFDAGGLGARVAANSPSVERRIRRELIGTITKLEPLEPLGARAYTDETARDTLVAAGFSLKVAFVLGGQLLADATGLVLGFGADDGD